MCLGIASINIPLFSRTESVYCGPKELTASLQNLRHHYDNKQTDYLFRSADILLGPLGADCWVITDCGRIWPNKRFNPTCAAVGFGITSTIARAAHVG